MAMPSRGHPVVARSLDRATWRTEGLRFHRGRGDLRSARVARSGDRATTGDGREHGTLAADLFLALELDDLSAFDVGDDEFGVGDLLDHQPDLGDVIPDLKVRTSLSSTNL